MIDSRTKRIRSMSLILCWLALFLVLGGCSQKPESPLPLEKLPPEEVPPGMIAFVSDAGGKLYVMGTDGSNRTHIGDNSGNTLAEPTWSPDGQYIAFYSERSIWVVKADGSGQVQVSDSAATDVEFRWSPDSGRIAFIWERDGNAEVYLVGRDGSGLTNLTNDPALENTPVWSPDGGRIAFYSGRGGGGIYIMNVDDTNVEWLVDGDSPTWSPDGKRIAYQCQEGVCLVELDKPTQSDLVTRVKNSSFVEDLSWSPDGRQLAFVEWRAVFMGAIPDTLVVVGVEESTPLRLRGRIYGYSWSPDGQYIALSSCQECTTAGSYRISVIHVASRRQFQLPHNPGNNEYSPTWRP